MVKVQISNNIRLVNLPKDIQKQFQELLTITNPDYEKNIRLGFWNGNTPKTLNLYMTIDNDLIIPYGLKNTIIDIFDKNSINYQLDDKSVLNDISISFNEILTLRDYQIEAINETIKHDNGILVSPCGSGKTTMGMYLIKHFRQKTLWITHTHDLLNQSKNVAKKMFNNTIGTITEGKVDIKDITFATVQTLVNVDLESIKNEFGLIIVDECHKATGTPNKLKMFYKVINSLSAKHKFGLTATLFTTKKSITVTPIYLLGERTHEVKKEDIDRVNAIHIPIVTPTIQSDVYLNTDRTLNYSGLVEYLVYNPLRNNFIVNQLVYYKKNYNIILSDRLDHLELLSQGLHMLGYDYKILTGAEKKKEREIILNDFKLGNIHFLFSTYKLFKEGIDVPIADVLHLAFPIKDKTTLIQSKGRVERLYEGKDNAYVIDYVDNAIGFLNNMYIKRKRVLK